MSRRWVMRGEGGAVRSVASPGSSFKLYFLHKVPKVLGSNPAFSTTLLNEAKSSPAQQPAPTRMRLQPLLRLPLLQGGLPPRLRNFKYFIYYYTGSELQKRFV